MRSIALACVLLFGCLSSGCVHYRREPVNIQIVDGDTGEPIDGVDVRFQYLAPMLTRGPKADTLTTDSDGRTEGRIAIGGGLVLTSWRIWHPGFAGVNGHVDLEPETREYWRPYSQMVTGDDHWNVIPLYKDPPPEIRVILPDGYRGPVYIDVQRGPLSDRLEPGQRVFEFEAAPNGYVHVEGPPLFDLAGCQWTSVSSDRGAPTNWRFRYESASASGFLTRGELSWSTVFVYSSNPNSHFDPEVADRVRAHRVADRAPKKIWFIGTDDELKMYMRKIASVEMTEGIGTFGGPDYETIEGLVLEAARTARKEGDVK